MNKRVLVIGEVCIDSFVTCSITRLCPEGPVPILNPVSSTENYGMAGNVVANLKSLGIEYVRSCTPNATIIKTRYVDQQTGALVMRVDEDDCVKPIEGVRLDSALDDVYDAIVISSYDKGFLTQEHVSYIAGRAKTHDIPTFLDTKWMLGEWSKDITVVKINEREYQANCKASPSPWTYCENLIVTEGDRGAWWVNEDIQYPVDPIAVADVSGSGDSFLAGLVVGYLEYNGSIAPAIKYANRVARIAASKRGVVAVKAEEVV